MGQIEEALNVADLAVTQALSGMHIPTMVYVRSFKALLSVLRSDSDVGATDCQAFADLISQHDLPPVWVAHRTFYLGWMKWHRGEYDAGIADMQNGIGACRQQHHVLLPSFWEPILAEAEAGDARLIRIDEAIAEIGKTGHRQYEAEVHRVRGEILLKRDTTNSTAAELAFLTATAVAQQQKARSLELRAALSLAKLYQSTGRAADAHAVLAPALEGFAPTPDFPEIEQAEALLAAFAETDEVKNAAAARRRRLKLQTDYGLALLWSKGYGSEEAKAAYGPARDLPGSADDPSERFAIYYGQWLGYLAQAELNSALETAAAFLRDAENARRPTETAAAHRSLGLTRLFLGDLLGARASNEDALRIYDPERDRDAAFRFGTDTERS
jgi:hypothetical protein